MSLTELENDNRTDTLSAALGRRLVAIAPHLAFAGDAEAIVTERGVGPLIDELVRALLPSPKDRDIWLLLVAVSATFPLANEVRRTRRALIAASDADAFSRFLGAAAEVAVHSDALASDIDIVVGSVVVDVDFCARHLHNTGIQRVVRQTVSRWDAYPDRHPELVGWTDSGRAMRRLDEVETARVVDWSAAKDARTNRADGAMQTPPVLVVPIDSTVAIVEVPRYELCDPLASLAEFSGNRVVAIGYDAIPVVSADTVPAAETERFVRYLSFIKHAHTVAAISESVQIEFAGFSSSVVAQGLTGPDSVEVALPIDTPDAAVEQPVVDHTRGDSLVLCVGSQEPRKNHDAVLFAAEVLWREGLQFSLRFIGRGSVWFTKGFDRRIATLAKKGRDVAVLRRIDDEEMLANYRRARFTVFPSLQEGYGLPVAESLALNTPVITTGYGSTGEIARDGGCLVIDPRDDDTIANAMRTLLTDQETYQRLVREIDERPRRTWDDYAAELWAVVAQEGRRA